MKKAILFLFVLAALPVSAQQAVKFGYLSYDSVMQAMPEYAEMQTNMQQLRTQYEAEMKRVEDDFNKKYEEFLDGQASYPKTILQKRQSELQEMLNKNIAFKKESQQLLDNAESSMLEGIRSTVTEALITLGHERGYAFILNTDKDAVPFINPSMGEDITADVKAQLLSR